MRKKKNTKESQLSYQLGICSKQNNLKAAISLYESALSDNLTLCPHHFNSLIHVCSSPCTLSSDNKSLAVDYGFKLFSHMVEELNIAPTEATITQVARLAVARGDPGYGVGLIREWRGRGVAPKLRTYSGVLLGLCEGGRAEEAYALEEEMGGCGVGLEEGELRGLLGVSVGAGRGERVYGYLLKLRGVVSRGVSEETGRVVEEWFTGEKAREVGIEEWDVGRVREERERNGGGWHGMGWLGRGEWEVKREHIRVDGGCCGCGERLVCVDIDCEETERFAGSVAGLAMEREAKSNFKGFVEWIEKHPDYEAIVDAANIGLYQQNFADGGFSIAQLEAIVRELYNRNKKWPLVVLHNKRLETLRGNPANRKLLDEWLARGTLYATPNKSNDDWYWLYAAVKLKCLLVTNDEMRDHIFELLGSNFFLQWKERHQVHYTFVKGLPKLKMPPTYSILIQESETGSWHVPLASESTDELSRSWLCITRPSSSSNSSNFSTSKDILHSCNNVGHNSRQSSENGVASVTGKRKERE